MCQESMDLAALNAALTDDAQNAISMLKQSVSTKLVTKLPHAKSTSWIPDLHLANLHLPIVQSEQQLRREEIAACKVLSETAPTLKQSVSALEAQEALCKHMKRSDALRRRCRQS